MYIYTVTVHLQDHCAYLDIFTKTDMGGGGVGFGLKCVKLGTFCILGNYPLAGVVSLSCLIRIRFSESQELGL